MQTARILAVAKQALEAASLATAGYQALPREQRKQIEKAAKTLAAAWLPSKVVKQVAHAVMVVELAKPGPELPEEGHA